MADAKISALTAYTPAISTDVVPIVDVTAGATKKITVANLMAAGSGSWVFNETPSGTVNGTTTAFDTANTFVAGSIQVFRDGQLMKGGGADYTETDTNTITFTTAPVSGSVLLVHYQKSTASFGNADTLDAYHANATPTAGQIPVLDSEMAMINGNMARQAIINGNFDVWQRGTTYTHSAGTTLAPTYTGADRWLHYFDPDSGTLPTLVFSRQLLTSGDIPNAFYHYRVAPNGAGTSLGNGSLGEIVQRIEYGTRFLCGNGKKVTVSFYARSSIANKKIGISLEQNYGSGGAPSSTEIITGTTWTLTSSWVKYTYTFTTNTLSGKTFGTVNDDYLQLNFGVQWGSTNGTTFGYGSAETYVGSGNIDIAQVQLCAGDVALPFQPKSFNQELIDCQRYYETSYEIGTAAGTTTETGAIYFTDPVVAGNSALRYLVSKRIAPTLAFYSPATGATGKYRDFTSNADFDLAAAFSSTKGCKLTFSNHGAADELCSFQYTADAEL